MILLSCTCAKDTSIFSVLGTHSSCTIAYYTTMHVWKVSETYLSKIFTHSFSVSIRNMQCEASRSLSVFSASFRILSHETLSSPQISWAISCPVMVPDSESNNSRSSKKRRFARLLKDLAPPCQEIVRVALLMVTPRNLGSCFPVLRSRIDVLMQTNALTS